MGTTYLHAVRTVSRVVFVLVLFMRLHSAGGVELVTRSSLGPSSTAGGDSFVVAVTPGGEYVLLNSNARNLATNPPAGLLAARVYVRDTVANTTAEVMPDYSEPADFFGLSISADGRHVLLQAVSHDGAQREILLVDRNSSTTTIVSRPAAETQANGPATEAVMTPDGKFVAFVSGATNLVAGDSNRIADVFLRDTTTGVTRVVSKGAKLHTVGGALVDASFEPVLSRNGSKVLFASSAPGISEEVSATGNTRYTDLYLWDAGEDIVEWVSRDSRSLLLTQMGIGAGDSYGHCMSDDGRYITFLASGRGATSALVLRYDAELNQTSVIYTNALAGGAPFRETASVNCSADGRFLVFAANSESGNNVQSVLLWDSSTGNLVTVSESLANTTGTNIHHSAPVVSEAGDRVVFMSDSPILVTNALASGWHVFERDRSIAATRALDVGADGASTGGALERALITTNASAVYFHTLAPLVPNDFNGAYDVFRATANSSSPWLISFADTGLPSFASGGGSSLTEHSVDAAGMLVAFSSMADDLVAGDDNGRADVFVRHLVTGATTLVSVNTSGTSGFGGSFEPSISPDGRYVAFTSNADDLVPGDTNYYTDVFLRDLVTGTTRLVSVFPTTTYGLSADCFRPMVSDGGRYVLFLSRSKNLVPNVQIPSSSPENLFLRDMQANVTYALTTAGCGPVVSFTPDFSRLGFAAKAASLSHYSFQVWDSASNSRILTNTALGGAVSALSPNGAWYAGWSSNQSVLTAYAMDGASNIVVYSGSATAPTPGILKFTPDARRLVFTTWSNVFSGGLNYPFSQVFLYDFPSGTLTLVSHAHTNVSAAASGSTVDAAISSDGRFVAFISKAPNVVPEDPNSLADLFVYDSETGENTRVGPATGDHAVTAPGALAFSARRPLLLFENRGDTLLPNDFNNRTDIFATLLPLGSIELHLVQSPVGSLTISWPADATQTYRVQYKDSPGDTEWKPLNQLISLFGGRAWVMDTPSAAQRYYRVVAE